MKKKIQDDSIKINLFTIHDGKIEPFVLPKINQKSIEYLTEYYTQKNKREQNGTNLDCSQ
jgi:hypothetical protein